VALLRWRGFGICWRDWFNDVNDDESKEIRNFSCSHHPQIIIQIPKFANPRKKKTKQNLKLVHKNVWYPNVFPVFGFVFVFVLRWVIEFLWQFRWLFDDLLLDSRRKGKQKNQKLKKEKKGFYKKKKKERGTLRLYEVFNGFGCWGRRGPCSKEFQTQLKWARNTGTHLPQFWFSVPSSEFRIWELGFATGLCEEFFWVESGRNCWIAVCGSYNL
jgi:hypothetical protein